MKTRIVSALVVFGLVVLGIVNPASALSRSLTTTIMITVKGVPQSNLLPDNKNADVVNALAINQGMTQAYIKEAAQDLKSSAGKIYTITDRL